MIHIPNHYQFAPTNIDQFNARFARVNESSLGQLENCPALEEFLPRAIEFLKQDGNRFMNEQVAHYLMGKTERLPEGLAMPRGEISRSNRRLLDDLLRTHRHGCIGNREASAHTITKLQELGEKLFGYPAKIKKWIRDAPPGELAARTTAQSRIEQCKRERGDTLNFTSLGLTSIPPIPRSVATNLRAIGLMNNKFESLEGLPSELSNLRYLNVADNSITSLKGAPQKVGLNFNLNIDRNRLESLQGLPHYDVAITLEAQHNQIKDLKDMPSCVKELNLGDNQLTSLEGMPSELNSLEHLDLTHNSLNSLQGLSSRMPKIERIKVDHNKITTLDGLSDNVRACYPEITIADNPLTRETSDAIHGYNMERAAFMEAGRQARIDAAGSLETEIKRWFNDMDTSFCADYPVGNKNNLATLLHRLHKTAAFQGEDREHCKAELKAILEKINADDTFREYCFIQAHLADEDCEDQVQSVFDDMRQQLHNPATQKDCMLTQLIDYHKSCERARLVSCYVGTYVPGRESLESGMRLQHELQEHLGLPIKYHKSIFRGVAEISYELETHKQQAVEFVEKELKTDKVIERMLNDAPTVAFLKKAYPSRFAGHQLMWVDVFNPSSPVLEKNDAQTGEGSKLLMARALPMTDGKRQQTLQSEAEQNLLYRVASHAMTFPTMSAEERRNRELEDLFLHDADWIDYIRRADIRGELRQPDDPTSLTEQELDLLFTERAIAKELSTG